MADKREIIDTGTSLRSIRRDPRGRFTTDQSLVNRSLVSDQRDEATRRTPRAQTDHGNRSH